ncbi:hypothetical protein PMAYCL1PPCAC_32503, partial [Pristionchus mayeri]
TNVRFHISTKSTTFISSALVWALSTIIPFLFYVCKCQWTYDIYRRVRQQLSNRTELISTAVMSPLPLLHLLHRGRSSLHYYFCLHTKKTYNLRQKNRESKKFRT